LRKKYRKDFLYLGAGVISLLCFILTILATTTVYASDGESSTYGVVTGTNVNVRLSAEIVPYNIIFKVNIGTEVEIHGLSGDFYHATVSGTSNVFISRDFVRVTYVEGTVCAPIAWAFELPFDDEGAVPVILLQGEIVVVKSVHEDWYGIETNGSVLYVKQSTLDVPQFVELPAARLEGTIADDIIETAMTYLGTRYLYGGRSPNGFDCSGFVGYVFEAHGITLNRSSRDQARQGTAVGRDELQRGDLLFFGSVNNINHAALYIGDELFIHSSSDRSGGVIISDLNAVYNVRSYVTARRVL